MMAIESRTTIEPGDVVAVELECLRCHCRFACALDEWRIEPTGCRNCGASWGAFQDKEIKQLEHLLALLRVFGNLQAKEVLPFKLRFEIAQSPRKETV